MVDDNHCALHQIFWLHAALPFFYRLDSRSSTSSTIVPVSLFPQPPYFVTLTQTKSPSTYFLSDSTQATNKEVKLQIPTTNLDRALKTTWPTLFSFLLIISTPTINYFNSSEISSSFQPFHILIVAKA